MSYTPEEAEDEGAAILDEIKTEGPALVVRSGGGRAGEHFLLENDSTTVGRSPDCDVFLDDVTVSRRHAQVLRRDGQLRDRGQGQPQRHVPQPPPDRVGTARGRRRGPDRQVQADLPLVSAAAQAPSRSGLLHIGAVCRHLRDEFPDVSISKIRYLEEQGLLAPKRTRGGYRLFDEDAVERLRTILRLQRDQFLPLRVIRQELASPAAGKSRRRREAAGLAGPEEELDARELVERSGATPQLLRELEEYGLLEARGNGGRSGTRQAMPRSRPCARGSRRSESGRATCARFGPRPTARRRCSSSSSGRLFARATPSAARLLWATCGRSPSSRRSSHSCSSGALSDTSLPSDGRRRRGGPEGEDPRRPGLAAGGHRLQGHHAAARGLARR